MTGCRKDPRLVSVIEGTMGIEKEIASLKEEDQGRRPRECESPEDWVSKDRKAKRTKHKGGDK